MNGGVGIRRNNRKKLKNFIIFILMLIIIPLLIKYGVDMVPKIAENNLTKTAEVTAETTTLSYNYLDDRLMLSEGLLEDFNSISDNEDEMINENLSTGGKKPYPESLEERSGTILTMAFGKQTSTQYMDLPGGGQLRNLTSIPNSEVISQCNMNTDIKLKCDINVPEVLIMHTHTTESFEPYSRDFYDASFNSRTTDETMNVVAVGEALTEELRSAGIGVIHDRTVHDYPSYNGSYDRSRATVSTILAQNPSIKIVIDLHRDALERDNGDRIAPVITVDKNKAAQIMIISGCDDGTMNMANFYQNLHFASFLEREFETDYKGISRGILFTYKKYNQDLTTGSLLFEIGSHANSIDQVLYTGKLIGKSMAKALLKLKE